VPVTQIALHTYTQMLHSVVLRALVAAAVLLLATGLQLPSGTRSRTAGLGLRMSGGLEKLTVAPITKFTGEVSRAVSVAPPGSYAVLCSSYLGSRVPLSVWQWLGG
jgi:hypothetical protein